MKKTRILIPALAMIAFSTAASIAGSVAWFTASRQTSVNAGTYAVVKTTANLDCTVTGVLGTSASGNVVTVTDVLTDGSFNHKTGKIYQPNSSGTGFAETNPEVAYDDADVEEKLTRGTTSGESPKTIYTAVMFELAFKINLGSANNDYGLFLDCYNHTNAGAGDEEATHEGSKFTCADDYLYTAPGFRMGFYSTSTNAQKRVIGALQTAANSHYVGDNDGTDAYDFSDPTTAQDYSSDLVYDTYDEALPAANANRATVLARPDCLGHFAYNANTSVTLTYTVVAWFEGTDPEIVNRAALTEYQSVTAKLYFEAVPLADAE